MNWPGYYMSSYGCDPHGMWSRDDRHTVNVDDRCVHSGFETGFYTTLNCIDIRVIYLYLI